MTQDELLKLLGLENVAPATDSLEIVEVDAEEQEETEVGPTVLNLTDWDLEQGDRLREHLDVSRETMGDFFNLFYAQRPEVAGQCEDGKRQQFVEQMMESESYRALHEGTRANMLGSEVAAITATREFCKVVEEQEQEREAAQERGEPAPSAQDEQAGMIAAAHKALQEAAQEVQEMDDAMQAMGCGDGQGSDSTMDRERLKAMFQKVRNSSTLKRICELAGKMRLAARAAQRVKTVHGSDEVVGVTLGDQIERLVPSEMAMLVDEDLELDALRRLVEKQSMMRQMRGREKQAKGPIVVVVDESGSMAGDKIAAAKALALTLGWIAKRQKRWIALVGFAGGTEGTRCAFPPGAWDEQKLIAWLEHFYGGGTSMDVPLEQLPTTYWDELQCPKGKTDVVMITDALVRVPAKMRESFNAWKQREQVKVITLVIESQPGEIGTVSDEVHSIPSINLDAEGVQNCLSI